METIKRRKRHSFAKGLQYFQFVSQSVLLSSYHSYVQMLERQHVQLVAGLQEFYRRTQTGQGWSAPPLELTNHGQPLTHKILEHLGILTPYQQDSKTDQGDTPSWLDFDQQFQEGSGTMYDTSSNTSPSDAVTFSPVPDALVPFPNSTVAARRICKYEMPTSQTIDVPVVARPQSLNGRNFPYGFEPNPSKPSSYSQGMHQQLLPPSMSTVAIGLQNERTDNPIGSAKDDSYMKRESLPFGTMSLGSVTDDIFDPAFPQGLPSQAQ